MIDEPLEPPGTIAVIGAGATGLEAALYGRCLGYDVTVLEAVEVGQSWRGLGPDDQTLPFLPDRGLSNLAMTAVRTQHEASGASPRALPMTVEQWIDEALEGLAASDLLAGRVWTHCRVTGIELALTPVVDGSAERGGASDEAGEADEDEPAPDFLLWLKREDGGRDTLQVEAVIDTTGGESFQRSGFSAERPADSSEPDADFRTRTPYYYRLRQAQHDSVEADLAESRDQIRRLFAMLGDRAGLDLYRPFRM